MGEMMTWQVHGMDCGSCERRLGMVLGRVDGVGEVDADRVTGRVTLRFDPSRVAVDELAATVADRIERAGFTVIGPPQAGGRETTR